MIRTYEQDGFTVTVRHVPDENADLTYLEETYTEDTDEARAYNERNAERLADYRRGNWGPLGVVVDIRRQTRSNWADGGPVVGHASVWGNESDSDPAYFAELERDITAEAWAEVDRLREALGPAPQNT